MRKLKAVNYWSLGFKEAVFSLLAVFCLRETCVYSSPREKQMGQKIGVVVSILPQAEFVARVGGDKVEITVMVPPGDSPHTYEPKPSQLKKVSQAKMYAKVGSGVEFELAWMDKITALNKKMLVVDCARGIKLEGDPHIWLSPQNAKMMVENIYQGLIQIDSHNQAYYLKNKTAYWQELDRLDKEINQVLSRKKK